MLLSCEFNPWPRELLHATGATKERKSERGRMKERREGKRRGERKGKEKKNRTILHVCEENHLVG